MAKTIPFSQLADADLTVEAVYEGGTAGNASDDPLGKLVPVGNQGGFRYAGWPKNDNVRMVVLYTTGAHRDWPDTLDRETGLFTYFGDNREPGKELHNTSRGGNAILRTCFDRLHGSPPKREKIPPFLLFDKASQAGGRDVRFLGLAVPGAIDVQPTDDLVAIWRTAKGERFQNYRATFTILDVATVSRAWLDELAAGQTHGASCPRPYRDWVTRGKYTPLESPRTIAFRTKDQQMPETGNDLALVMAIYDYFEDPTRSRLARSSSGACRPRSPLRTSAPAGQPTAAATLTATTTSAPPTTASNSPGRWRRSATGQAEAVPALRTPAG